MGLRNILAAAAGMAVLAAGVSSASAQTQPNPNAVRVHLSYFASTSDINIEKNTDNPQGSLITNNNAWKNGWGGGASYEYKVNPLIGVAVGASYFRPKVALASTQREDSVQFVPVTAGVNFHFGKPDGFDFWVGPEAAYVWYGKFSVPIQSLSGVTGTADIKFDNELTWGGAAGFDFPVNPNLAISVGVDYIAAQAKVKNDPNAFYYGIPENYKTNPRPIFINAGVSFRF